MTSPSDARPAAKRKALNPIPAEPMERDFVLQATRVQDGRVFLLTRKENELWNNVTVPEGVTPWANFWGPQWTRQRLVGVQPDHCVSKVTFEYGHRPNEAGERTFCASDEWDQKLADSHEAWRTVTTWDDHAKTTHRGAWARLPFPRD
jgi:hypothetical protein